MEDYGDYGEEEDLTKIFDDWLNEDENPAPGLDSSSQEKSTEEAVELGDWVWSDKENDWVWDETAVPQSFDDYGDYGDNVAHQSIDADAGRNDDIANDELHSDGNLAAKIRSTIKMERCVLSEVFLCLLYMY